MERRDEGAAKVVLRAITDLCRVLGLDAPGSGGRGHYQDHDAEAIEGNME